MPVYPAFCLFLLLPFLSPFFFLFCLLIIFLVLFFQSHHSSLSPLPSSFLPLPLLLFLILTPPLHFSPIRSLFLSISFISSSIYICSCPIFFPFCPSSFPLLPLSLPHLSSLFVPFFYPYFFISSPFYIVLPRASSPSSFSHISPFTFSVFPSFLLLSTFSCPFVLSILLFPLRYSLSASLISLLPLTPHSSLPDTHPSSVFCFCRGELQMNDLIGVDLYMKQSGCWLLGRRGLLCWWRRCWDNGVTGVMVVVVVGDVTAGRSECGL